MEPVKTAEIKTNIGDKLKKLRKDYNLTLAQMAKKCGTSASFMSEIENGKKFPSIKILYNTVTSFGISLDYLVYDKDFSNLTLKYIDDNTKLHIIKNFEKVIFEQFDEKNLFCFEIKDNALIYEGLPKNSTVIIYKTDDVFSGNMVLIKHNEGFKLRKMYKSGDSFMFCAPDNKEYESLIIENKNLDEIEILGKAICYVKYF
jgi:transcriptional regulator with XRE-family HTH domain